jgi:16S rRNA (cytidine1402-2'-O)-methyltransferase
MKGKLYLIPSFIGTDNPKEVFPEFNREIITGLEFFIVEELRTSRRFLKKIVPEIDINKLNFSVLNEHTKSEEMEAFLVPCQKFSIGLISEAGIPCVADPGSEVVKMAHEKGIDVIPLIGPSSIYLSLMASGLNGQNFAFNGYLPVDKQNRKRVLKFLEHRSFVESQTQLFIETPYRNNQILGDILETCSSDTLLCVACDITLPSQIIKTHTIASWKNIIPDLGKRQAIFSILKPAK